ncbi:hypothetical protein, partial [Pseudomonas pergaminensis]
VIFLASSPASRLLQVKTAPALYFKGLALFFVPGFVPQPCCNQCSAQTGAEVNLQGASLIY